MLLPRAFALLLLCPAALCLPALADPVPPDGQPASISAGENRIWTETIREIPGRHAGIQVEYASPVGGDQPIALHWQVTSRHRFEHVSVHTVVRDADDQPVFEMSEQVSLEKGVTDGRSAWNAVDAAPGVYRITLAATRAPDGVLAAAELRVRILDSAQLAQTLAAARSEAATMRDHLDRLAAQGRRPAYAEQKTRIAEDFAALAESALDLGDWPRAEAYALYVLAAVDSVRASLTFSPHDSQLTRPVDIPDLSQIRAEKGGLTANGRPVILIGASGGPVSPEFMDQLARYGLNYAVVPVRDDAPASDPTALSPAALTPILDAAARCNISVTAQHVASDRSGASPASGEPDAQLRQIASANLARALADRPMLTGLSVAHGPRFRFGGDTVRQGFIADVESRYPDLYTLNRLWRARLTGFDAIELAWDLADAGAPVPNYINNRPYRFDWISHHLRLGTGLTARRLTDLREAAPGLPLQVTFEDVAFELGEAVSGVDEEALAPLFDAVGCAVTVREGGDRLAVSYPEPNVFYTLLQSFAPDKPLFVNELTLQLHEDPYAANLYDVTYTALWEAAVRGASALGIQIPSDVDSLTAPGSPFAMPDVLDAAATACLDLNRLADALGAFHLQQADVAILWSRSSRIYDGGAPFLPSLLSAYEGASFFGRQIRFITEDQCAAGVLDNTRVLVLPDALSLSDEAYDAVTAYVARGGILLRHPRPAPYNELGLSRRAVLDRSDATFLIRGEDAARAYFHAMDAVDARGLLETRPRLVNRYGYPIEGVSTRTAALPDGDYLMYAANLRPEPVEVRALHAAAHGRDLIADAPIRFPMVLEPLQPMLVRLGPPDPARAPEPTDAPAAADPGKRVRRSRPSAGRPVAGP